jgi:hypothetical protein
MALERAQVVVDLLPRESDLAGQRAGRPRFGELGEEPGADGVERNLRRLRVFDDCHVEHGGIVAPIIQIVKTNLFVGASREWRFSEWRFSEWRFSEWRFSEWRFREWRFREWRFREWRFREWRFREWRFREWRSTSEGAK